MLKKERLIWLFLVFLISGCVNSTYTKQELERQVKAKYPIVGFIDEFVETHPNFDNNDVTREQADTDFVKAFAEASDSVNLLRNIPVELCSINKNSNGDVYAQFRSWRNNNLPQPINRVNFDVICRIDSTYVESLSDDSCYLIYGKLIKRIETIDVFRALLGRPTIVYTYEFNVRKDGVRNDKYEVNLGMLFFEIDSICPYTR